MIIIGILAFCFCIMLFVFLIEGKRECKRLKVREFQLKNEKISTDLKLAVLSDFHGNIGLSDKILSVIRREMPDVICVPGDFISAAALDCHEVSLELLKKLTMIAPVFFSLGNHEENLRWNEEYKFLYDDILHIEANYNLKLLDNCSTVYKGIRFHGFSPDLSYYARIFAKNLSSDEIKAAIGDCDDLHFNILLAHHPDYFKAYCEWGAELVIAGHNHGGLVRIPYLGGLLSPRLHLFPKYDYGMFAHEKTHMLVSNGLGAHTLKIRVNNIPEIQIINLKSG